MSESWFSACLRFATTIGAEEATYADSVVVFRSDGWEVALDRAIDVGRGMEVSYENIDRERVERRFVEVRTLDELGAEIADGREIFCAQAVAPEEPVARPEDSRPGQTGV